jgi:pimeloyl-ACP methyl ester carboxylesterase
MYYEIHGSGQPLVLLHGAFGFIEGWATVLPTLTKTHQVIAIELEGHGHTHDLDRPLSFEQMAEDTGALLKQLKIKDADFFGYSMGGTVDPGSRHSLSRNRAQAGQSSARLPVR